MSSALSVFICYIAPFIMSKLNELHIQMDTLHVIHQHQVLGLFLRITSHFEPVEAYKSAQIQYSSLIECVFLWTLGYLWFVVKAG